MEITIDGQQELFSALDRTTRAVAYNAAKRGLVRAGLSIIADAQQNLRSNGSWATGFLANTGKVVDNANGKTYRNVNNVRETGGTDGEQSISVGFMEGTKNYAGAVEYGSKPHWTSVSNFFTWVSKKFHVRNGSPECTSIAYGIQHAIARNGGKPHPFFAPAVKKNQKAISDAIAEAVRQTIDNGK